MYLFRVCFTGLHFVSLKPFWLQDLHLRFILGVYLKKPTHPLPQAVVSTFWFFQGKYVSPHRVNRELDRFHNMKVLFLLRSL